MSFKQHKKRWVAETFNTSTVWVNPGVDTIYITVKNADGGGGGATANGSPEGGDGAPGAQSSVLRADLLVQLYWQGGPGGKGGVPINTPGAAQNTDVARAAAQINAGDGPQGGLAASGEDYNSGRSGWAGKMIDRFPFPANGFSVTFNIGAGGGGGAAGSGSGQPAGVGGQDAFMTIEYEV